MKIAIVTNFYNPSFGVNTYFLCRELGRLGIEVILFASDKYGKKKPPKNDSTVYEEPFEVVRVPARFVLGNMPIYKNLPHLLDMNGPYDLIQTEDSYQPYSETVALYAHARKIPLVLRHDLFEDPPFPYNQALKFTEWLYGRNVAKEAKVATVILPEAGKYLRGLNPLIDYRVVPFGVEMQPVQVPREKNSILTVARLIKTKGVLDLIDALGNLRNEFPDFKATLIGKGPLEQEIKARAREKGIQDNLEMIPFVLHNQLAPYYCRASVFVLPTYAEAPGLSIAESLACGTPVVSYDIPTVRSWFTSNDEGILVKPGNVPLLTLAISRVLNSPKRFSPRDFSWRLVAKQMKEIYQEVLKVPLENKNESVADPAVDRVKQ